MLFYIAIPSNFTWKNTKILRKFCSGTVKWTQVSEDLVPVNISCSQDATGIRFHVTAYNSQVWLYILIQYVNENCLTLMMSESGEFQSFEFVCFHLFQSLSESFLLTKKKLHIVHYFFLLAWLREIAGFSWGICQGKFMFKNDNSNFRNENWKHFTLNVSCQLCLHYAKSWDLYSVLSAPGCRLLRNFAPKFVWVSTQFCVKKSKQQSKNLEKNLVKSRCAKKSSDDY